MNPNFKTYRNQDRVTPALYYTGHNAIVLHELAKIVDTELTATGAGHFRFWSDADGDQRVIHPNMWVMIDEGAELHSVHVEEWAKNWSVEETTGPELVEEHMPANDHPVLRGTEMTSEEFVIARQKHMDEARRKLAALPDADELVAEAEPPEEAPATDLEDDTREDRSGWTKEQWLFFRVTQGYSKNQIAKLAKPLLAALPDTVPQ